MENIEGGGFQPQAMAPQEAPQMSEAATLVSIFFEPGKVFEDLRRKPRFIMAGVIIAILFTGYAFGLYYKIGDAGMRSFMSEQFDKNPRTQGMTGEQKSNAIDLQLKIGNIVRFVLPVIVLIFLAIGGLIYWLGSKAFGGTGGFLHGLAVWVYSSLPPTVVGMLANYLVLALKSADDIDVAASQRTVLHANLGFLVDGKAMPVLGTLLATVDIFFIWGWILAAIGLRITNRLSSSSAWTLTIIIALIGIAFRVIGALFSGNVN
ncbi:MAG: YIP1 family protein [Acidobacteriota bacterium]